MSIFDSLWDAIARRVKKRLTESEIVQAYSDADLKGFTFSVEDQISEALADLVALSFTMPIEGSERAKWLDDIADDYIRTKFKPSIVKAFLTGDCLIVPSWNGRNFDNSILGADKYQVFKAQGDELLSVACVMDKKRMSNGITYTLLQLIELEPYITQSGEEKYLNRYTLYIAEDDVVKDFNASTVPAWSSYNPDWFIPDVEHLLVGRLKSNAVDPSNPNTVKGIPICYGASQPIKEIHYLMDQMHEEFDKSEKMIFADKRLFKTEWHGDEHRVTLPKGRDRLFTAIAGVSSDATIHDWAPEIRYMAYLEALDRQQREVEKCVGVSRGIISDTNDLSYENVDNVRKSQQKTMSFVDASRKCCEAMLEHLVYSWNIIANYYNLAPLGDYSLVFNWSNEYVETFADKQNAILAGEAIGATDAVDYRMFLYNEAPDVAAEKVAEIKANKATAVLEVE